MGSLALLARVLMALIFATAAVGKLLDRPGSRRALADFGLPGRALAPVALLLPLVELGTALGLVVQQTARWGAVAAIALLLTFVARIARAMARGQAPDCHCFGQLSSSPAGRGALIRNGALAVPAALVAIYGPGTALDAWLSARSAAELVAIGIGIAAVALAAFSLRLRLESRSLRRDLALARAASAAFPPGLPLGSPAPRFTLPATDGRTVTLDALLGRGKPLALVFVGPHCGPCHDLLPKLSHWQTTLADRITIVLLSSGDARANLLLAEAHGLVDMLVQEQAEVFEAYRARATPSGVMVTAQGRIGSRTTSGQVMVEAQVRRVLHSDPLRPPQDPHAQNGAPFEVRHWSGARAGG